MCVRPVALFTRCDLSADSPVYGYRQLFGPTFPGQYDVADKVSPIVSACLYHARVLSRAMAPPQSYYLGYEGGCIKFPIPQEFQHLYQNKNELPMEFPVSYD